MNYKVFGFYKEYFKIQEDGSMLIIILLLVFVICIFVASVASKSIKTHVYFCTKCGNMQGYYGNTNSTVVCEKCHSVMNEVPEKYVSESASEGFIAASKEKEFEQTYFKPLYDKYGKPEIRSLYFCKKCGTIHRFTGYAREKLQCTVCFLQLYKLPDEYKEDISWYHGLGNNELLTKHLKETTIFSEELAENRNKIHDEQWEQFNKVMEQGRQLMEEKSKKVTCQYCGSENVEKIGALNRAISVEMLGAASSKIGKQWHCKHCGSNF